MGRRKVTRERIRAAVKALGNPYASLSMPVEGSVQTRFEPSEMPKHDYLKKLENPYAYHAIFDDADTEPRRSVAEKTKIVGHARFGRLSKRDFQLQSRRIFLQYVPSEENRVLRVEHRDFINRNESRSAEEKYLLVEELRKYDLSTAGNYRPHFNREHDALTKAKLLEIERRIDSLKK